jgi:glycosyltransferase involved in cell wall biosynthesis
MDETIEQSLKSILNQVSEDFEVLVIDESTDDSINIIKRLESEYPQLRHVVLDRDPDRQLGQSRQIAVREANGNYILGNLDTDDVYKEGIMDFVHLYHRLEEQIETSFFLKGYSINMAPRELLLEIPYRNLQRTEDKDLWRRLFANDAMVWFEHDPFWTEIGYHSGTSSSIKNGFTRAVANFQNGIPFWSYTSFHLKELLFAKYGNRRSGAYQTAIGPIAWIKSLSFKQYTLPDRFKRKESLKEAIRAEKCSGIKELNRKYGLKIKPEEFSEVGRRAFFRETPSVNDSKAIFDNPNRTLGA